ncbi:hypothetical protein FE257_008230 [Aspergillus nanangensis]|uniref:Uncharacterized protein n=1 Tax=Aspergillus nanangensis TaxID=2582783 RepID=A0AAD4CLV1_ASPNN|nr:hypothetical protein FE257_008230 [Aspergillus nanangensis]
MMKALVFRGPYDVRELHRYRGHSKINMEPGYVCGHEGVGTVHKVGSQVKNFTSGDHVIVPCIISCKECFHCKRGVHGRCKQVETFGVPALDGSLAQYFRVPLANRNLYRLPEDQDLGELAVLMTDIFPTAYNGAKQAFQDTPPDEWKNMAIAVIGCGPVSLCAIIAAREYKPARIFAIDSNPHRLELAKTIGCLPINFHSEDPKDIINQATNSNGVHAVIEGVGLSPALRTAYDIICPGGKISSFGKSIHIGLDNCAYSDFTTGVHNGELPFTAAECYDKDIHIRFGRLPLHAVFEDALAVLVRNKDLITKLSLIDLVVPALDESFSDALSRFEKGELTKVVFKPNGLCLD